MTYPQNITPDAAVRYVKAHGVEVRTVGTSCLSVLAHREPALPSRRHPRVARLLGTAP